MILTAFITMSCYKCYHVLNSLPFLYYHTTQNPDLPI
nr:MAG TPA: hypothetical protein [Caudoviricetes sp.]